MPDIFDASKTHAVPHPDAHQPHHVQQKRDVTEYSRVMRQFEPSTNPFDAFAARPLSVHAFDSQLDDEQILLLLRQHPITQIPKVGATLILALLPLFFSFFPFFADLPLRFQFATYLLWYLLVAGFAIENFLTWFFNVYIVTDERIIDVDFISLIYRNISAAKIDNIEDLTATTSGALAAIVDYGTVEIQTAAEKRQFEFEGVPHPNKVTEFINELIVEEEQEKIEGRVS